MCDLVVRGQDLCSGWLFGLGLRGLDVQRKGREIIVGDCLVMLS